MAYETPTVEKFKSTHPLFADVPDQAVADAIAEGESQVGDTWREADRVPAVMLYAAHVLTGNGQGKGAEAQLSAEGLGDFQRIKSGTLDVARFERGSTGVASGLDSTSYGKRFKALLHKNFGGPRGVPLASRRVHPAAQDY